MKTLTVAEIMRKKKYGDWDMLAEMIGANHAQTATKRLVNGDKTAIEAMSLLIEWREKMVAEFHNSKMEIKNIDGRWLINGKRLQEASGTEREFLQKFFAQQNGIIEEPEL